MDIKAVIAKGESGIDAFNDAAFDNYNKALEKCPNCPRTFNPESLPKHLKGCKGEGGGGGGPGTFGSPPTREPEKPAIISRPKALMCYICGREYGTSSLEIHLKACRKKWDQEQEKKPPAQRKPCPEPPKGFG